MHGALDQGILGHRVRVGHQEGREGSLQWRQLAYIYDQTLASSLPGCLC